MPVPRTRHDRCGIRVHLDEDSIIWAPMLFPGKRRIFALGLVIIGTVWAGHAQEAKPAATPTPASPPIRLPSSSLKPDAVIALGGERRFAITPDGAWVSDRSAGTVTRIDPKSNAPDKNEKPLPIGKEPCAALVSAFKSLWTAGCASGTLVRLDLPVPAPTATPVATPAPPVPTATPKPEKGPLTEIKTGVRGPGPLTSATGSIWMLSNEGRSLLRVDPDTNAVVADITLPSPGNA